MKRLFIGVSLALVVLLVGSQLVWFIPSGVKDVAGANDCAFCKQNVLAKQQYYEGELTRVLLNYKPILPGHSLILPKRHVKRFEELTSDEFQEMQAVINKVQRTFEQVYGASDYLLLMQNGPIAGQTTDHTHFHMLPRNEKSVITKILLWWRMLVRPFQLHLSPDWETIEAERQKLSEAMAHPERT